MSDVVEFKWYVMENDANGAIRKADITTGPFYNETCWFHEDGYDSPIEAKQAIRAYCAENGSDINLFIVEGV